MDYELAKELKDAGFPQKLVYGTAFYEEDGKAITYVGECNINGETPGCGCGPGSYAPDVRVPTLEELTAACGQDRPIDIRIWPTNSSAVISGRGFGEGPTPLKAVAKLWIALNRK
jgi:hypothetical protein